MDLDRARGCMMGQLAGDSLGSLVEFKQPDEIRLLYPNGVRELHDGGHWNTIAGQPTDDSEMALMLARMLCERGTYDPDAALFGYRSWLDSGPFDCGLTIESALRGSLDPRSEANGALMRISPLGIFGARRPLEQVATWAARDASLTHPHPVCQQANSLYAMAISYAIATGAGPEVVYGAILGWAVSLEVEAPLMDAIRGAVDSRPQNYVEHQGWVLIAFQNALFELLHASDFEDGVVDTVMQGGDTDTNAAIAGALLGAVHGLGSVPPRWIEAVLSCRPATGDPGVNRPRPEDFWPLDAFELVDKLLAAGST